MIIGIKEADRVVLAFSSLDKYLAVNAADMTNCENAGVWKVKRNPHTVMGCAYPTAESDAFRYEEGIFRGEITYDRLIESIVPDMEEFAEDKDYIGNDKGRFEEFLIAQKGRLFKISSEHIACEIDSFVVIGACGEDFVKSVIYATQGAPAIDRIRKALEFASREMQYECYPIVVMDTKKGRLEVITK